jgi:hypothetical protein
MWTAGAHEHDVGGVERHGLTTVGPGQARESPGAAPRGVLEFLEDILQRGVDLDLVAGGEQDRRHSSQRRENSRDRG